jgi:hypothetical protein
MSNPSKQTPTADASIAASSSSSTTAGGAGEGKKADVPQLGALEEDDEFEEFAEQGRSLFLL